MPRVLIVEDDATLALTLRDGFEGEGYSVLVAGDGATGLCLASSKRPDVMILDVMLPGASGFDLCNQLRKSGNGVPIIFLSARGGESDRILGLKVGADDYVTKPVSFMELMAHVEAVLRRVSRPAQQPDRFRFGETEINFQTREATKRGVPLELSAREFEILHYFIQHPGEVVTRDQLLDAVWGHEDCPITHTVDVHMSKLRHKIEEDPHQPQHLITIHRTGYKFLP